MSSREDATNMERVLHYCKTRRTAASGHKAAGLQALQRVVPGGPLSLWYLVSCACNEFNKLFDAAVDIAGIPFGLRSSPLNGFQERSDSPIFFLRRVLCSGSSRGWLTGATLFSFLSKLRQGNLKTKMDRTIALETTTSAMQL